jgi:nucleotide-binding universal stress UspA family protein
MVGVVQEVAAGAPIIVGVDDWEQSSDALALADVLGSVLGRLLVLVHVHPYGRVASLLEPGQYEELIRETAEATFRRASELLGSATERRMQLVEAGSPSEGLSALAERERATLIVIGSSRRSRVGRIMPGGTAERLLTGGPAAVAVAPSGYAASERAPLAAVGCGFDGSPESRRALEWAAALARAAGACLCVVAVYEPVPSAAVAAGRGLRSVSVNEVLRQRQREELEEAVAALDDQLEATGKVLDGDVSEALGREAARARPSSPRLARVRPATRRAARKRLERRGALRRAPRRHRPPSRSDRAAGRNGAALMERRGRRLIGRR